MMKLAPQRGPEDGLCAAGDGSKQRSKWRSKNGSFVFKSVPYSDAPVEKLTVVV